MDAAIKQYADSLYEKALMESAATLRAEQTKFLLDRARTQGPKQLFSGVDFQAMVKVYAAHVERSVASRLDSYQKAFSEIGRPPTERELTEIIDDCKAAWELRLRHASGALAGFLATRGAPTGLDAVGTLRAASAHGYDRTLQDWKIWKGRALLKTSMAHPSGSETLAPGVAIQRESERLAGASRIKNFGRDAAANSAFISYSWDDDSHREWVRALAERLRADGVDVTIDRWATVPGDQLPGFMERAIRENEFVVIVCTPRYKQRSDSREGGVGYEGDIMTAEVMTTQNNRKFIPVLRSGTWPQAAPSWLVGKYYVDLSGEPYSDRQYEDLVRTLLGIRETAPPVGKPMATIARNESRKADIPAVNKNSEFEDIKITRVIVEEVTEPRNDGTPGCALYSIPFALSATPPPKWAQLFIQNWDHPPRFTGMHRPGIARVQGATVILGGTTIDEVERYHRDTLQLAVAETNKQYRDWWREHEERNAREDARARAHRKHIEDASKHIKFD